MTGEDERVSRSELEADLASLGLGPGDEVVVHSSLSSIGWVEGGADALVDAIRGVVGPDGTIAVPTFTSGVVTSEPFELESTASRTGAVTEAVRTRPAAHRSEHPTHSVSALGGAAATLTAEHPYDATVGVGSPLHRLAERGGSVLLIGVGHDRNTMLHVAERVADLAYTGPTREVLVAADDGPTTVEVAQAGCSKGFPAIEPVADEAGILSVDTVGDARSQLMTASDLIDVAVAALAEDPAFLLCDDPECWWCPAARDRLDAAGAIG